MKELKPNYIIEGPDGAGKTTLGKDMSRLLGYEFIYLGRPYSSKEVAEKMNIILDKEGTVFDRCPLISEYIYGRVLRNKTLVDYVNILNFFYPLKYGDVKINLIYKRTPLEILEERMEILKTKEWKDITHLNLVKSKIAQLYAAYEIFFNILWDSGIPFIKYESLDPPTSIEDLQSHFKMGCLNNECK